MNPLVSIAIEAARAAGRVIVKASERPDLIKVSYKSEGEYATDVDQRAEQVIIEMIQKSYPQHAILAEESGEQGSHEFTWIIDPLDGTKNFAHNFPHYAVSIAIQVGEKIEHGIIYDPIRDELFVASAGRGAQLNGRRLRLEQRAPERTLLAMCYPHPKPEEALDVGKKVAMLSTAVGGIRKSGSAALDLAYLAAGRVDMCLTNKLRIWDYAAGVLLISEAGGLVTDWQGGEDYAKEGKLFAAHPKLFKHFIKTVSQ